MILTYGESKVGLVRKVNEDAISLSVPDVYLLADGMGGYDGGQLASRLAVSAAEDFFRRKCEEPVSEALVKEAVLAANDAILAEKVKTPSLSSMGTTMVVCAFSKAGLLGACGRQPPLCLAGWQSLPSDGRSLLRDAAGGRR